MKSRAPLTFFLLTALALLCCPSALTQQSSGDTPQRSWGVTTQKGNRIFVHLLDWQDSALLLPRLQMRVTRAYLMQSGAPVEVSKSGAGTVLRLPAYDKAAPDNIVVMDTGR